MMNCPEPLAAVLHQLVADLSDPSKHYFLNASYYDHVGGDAERTRWWLAAMWLNEATVRNLEVTAEALLLDVLLNQKKLDQWTRISISYEQIWQIQYMQVSDPEQEFVFDERATTLFYDLSKMRLPPLIKHE